MRAWTSSAIAYRVNSALDATLVLQEHRGDLVYGLDLLEALLDHGLALWACRTCAALSLRSFVINGYMPSLRRS